MDNKMVINLAANFLTFALNLFIGFFFTPYIVNSVGAEAYGFVGLANNMVNYATIITIALNSVAGRFITIAFHKGDTKEANRYFTSVLISNIMLCCLITIFAIPIIINIDRFLNISIQLVPDVKKLFFFIYINFIVSIITTVYSVATFIKNKLYLSSLANILGAAFKVTFLCIVFNVYTPHVSFIGIATCLGSLIVLVFNMAYTKRLIPQIKLKTEYLSIKTIKILFNAGIWNTVTKLSQIFSDGLNLLIANIFVSPYYMGMLSVAQVVPNALSGLMGTIANLFNPDLTYYFAKDDKAGLIAELKNSMKITGFFTSIIFSIMYVFKNAFFSIWTPNENSEILSVLCILSMCSFLTSGVATSLQGIFLITNKLKINSFVWLGVGILDVIVIMILLKKTDLGIYAVASVSRVMENITNLTFVPLYAAKCIKTKYSTFYPIILRYVLTTLVMIFVFQNIQNIFFIVPLSWKMLLIYSSLFAIIGAGINFVLLLDRKEKIRIFKYVQLFFR